MRLVAFIMFGAACRSSAPAPAVPAAAPLANTSEPTHAEVNAKLTCRFVSSGPNDTVWIGGEPHSIQVEECEGPWRNDQTRDEEARLVFAKSFQPTQRQVIATWVRHVDGGEQLVMLEGLMTDSPVT
jgi:hypothetical protein